MSKKKILLLSDDLRVPSGVGTMSKSIVFGTCHKYDWVQVGGAVQHPEEGKIFDISKEVSKKTGVNDAFCKIYPVSGYGNEEIVRQIMSIEKPDAIMHFTDPRFWGWLYQMEHEFRRDIPLMYYNIWDDLPFPHWNEPFYESCDALFAISKQTYIINKHVCQNKPRIEGKDLFYVQHGIDENVYFPILGEDKTYNEFKQNLVQSKEYDFVALFNSRNIHRKRPSDLILAFTKFCESLTLEEGKKCCLILHTDVVDQHGTDLAAVAKAMCPYDVIFSNAKLPLDQLNYLYNIADVTCNPSSAEGFGLSHMESLMAGTPTITTVVGGLQDQLGFKVDGEELSIKHFTADIPSNSTGKISKENGEWTYPLWPQLNLQGSPMTPYIYDSRPTIESITDGLKFWYDAGKDERKRRGQVGRDWAIKNGFTSKGMCDAMLNGIDTCFETFKPRDRYTLIDTGREPIKYKRGMLI